MSKPEGVFDEKKSKLPITWIDEARDCYLAAVIDIHDGEEVGADWNLRRASIAATIGHAMTVGRARA